MSLEKWAEYGWLKAEPSSPEEIADLLGIVSRDLHDARVEAISEDRRFEAAFNAARTAANVALRASGYRTAVQAGHHLKTIESLELTIQADPRLIQKMRVFSKKRNATSYDSAGNVSDQELQEAIRVAEQLRQSVIVWLRENHPELTKNSC
jgi:MoxR-like ATPase